jgi:GNAT superfamily N-acetyltransferase
MRLEFKKLSEVPESIGLLARWYWEEWARHDGVSIARVEKMLQKYLSGGREASIVCGFLAGNLVCGAQLKERENKNYPQFQDWVGGAFVHKDHRNQGYGGLVIQETIRHAISLGVETLYLQTVRKDGGLYSVLGFSPVCETRHGRYDVLIMSKRLI